MGSTRPRKLSSGSLVFPHRGPAPEVPEGYEAEDGDPYVMHLTMPVCQHRYEKIVETGCCGLKLVMACSKYNKTTSRKECHKCTSSSKTET